MSSHKLFEPTVVGGLPLKHRIVLAPLTRFRTVEGHVPYVPTVKEYYSQRASAPGTLLIAEGTFVAHKAGGFIHTPGIWSPEQVRAWKEIVDAVHARGSFIFLQLFANGRAASQDGMPTEPVELVSASAIPLTGASSTAGLPRALTVEEIQEYVELFATAAQNAVHGAGFDGVEIHGANGYLLDQFLQDTANKRTDAYGGSVENRARFLLEATKAAVDRVGQDKVGVRLSPWSTFQDMGMDDPKPTFAYVAEQLRRSYPDFAYLHVVEPRIDGATDSKSGDGESNDFLRKIWSPKPYITAGAYGRDNAIEHVDKTGDLVAFGRHFISNPDLVRRLKEDIPLSKYDRDTFYTTEYTGKGYSDYPFAQ
ncbi:NADH:flavin oxidoreductase/NADH oxidase [Cylindrobasidium torrendii FP15055 ss-10]|uniref:NADH:flavin oxidoreductase/NADH oxidase n=1 Tax=Cylindrobasidium torrendii FP15055 ss-10 TaxID=1314674 RepID=A0A0D7BR38_9AGAR|nr:NADH:flavin oxidoreductase/NADH oxidase [Cylindrobasidium torrendii FP15055 ss-10]